MEFIDPHIISAVAHDLDRYPVTAIVGPRQVGKFTLVKSLLRKTKEVLFLDMERPSDARKLEDAELFLETQKDKLVCIDEVQRRPNLFPVMRVLVDEWKGKGHSLLIAFSFILASCYSSQTAAVAQDTDYTSLLNRIQLPEGFRISVYAANVQDARSLAMTPDGKTIFVGNRRKNNVYALTDTDGDMVADQRHTIATGLTMPNGVAYKEGDLYVAEVNAIHRFPDIMNNLDKPESEVIYDGYPGDRHHGWKFIAFGPDGRLYVPVGAPCNVCDKEAENEIYATITRMDPDGSNLEVYARGVRNSVGFAWHPKTGKMWFTDNGRDLMGDYMPACELNHVAKAGQHFGFPFWHQGDIADPDFGSKFPREKFVEPKYKFEPHSAPLGLRFYRGDMFPAKYKNNLIVAQHGSWNRSPEAGHTGYQLRFVRVEGDRVADSEIFASGWLDKKNNKGLGKPVDVMEMPDGSLLVSDDVAHCIYRITYVQ